MNRFLALMWMKHGSHEMVFQIQHEHGRHGRNLFFFQQHQLIIGRCMKISLAERVLCLTYIYIYIHNYIYISSMTPTQPQRTSCYWSVGLHQSPSCEFTQGSSMIRTWMNSWWVIGKVWWTMRILRAGVVWECFLVKVGWLDGFTSPGLIVAIGEEALLGAVADTSIY